MGRYISQEAVLVRLRGKVKTTDDPEMNPDRLPTLLLVRLIAEAEGQVEQDLSQRYMAPFQTLDGRPFAVLPENPTKNMIRTLCELMSVVRVLETDFGRGSASDAGKYSDSSQKRYDAMLWGEPEKKKPGLLTLREDTFNVFVTPPLPGLRSAAHVAAVDTGFAGYVSRSDDFGHGSYPVQQINSPSENFWNGFIDAEEQNFTEE